MTLALRILIGLGAVVALVVLVPTALIAGGLYKTVYMPSESMAPTFDVGDRFVVRMGTPQRINRGDIVLASAANGSLYAKRVAGLPGDRIAVAGGIVLLNGRPVQQRLLAEEHLPGSVEGPVRRLAEQFPGESAPHEIYDSGTSIGDDFAEQLVAPGHVFLLGDNRDHSADSRFSREEMGLEQVPMSDVRGVPWLFYYTVGRHRIGDSAGH